MRRLSAFISYRRNDSYLGGASDEPSLLQLIRTELIGLGFTDVFLDVSSLRVGETFDSRILREITECDLFIVLIGENWVKELKFRAENQLNDVAARELRAAMKMEKEIAAFLIDHAQMPSELELPQELIDFHYYDAARLASSADQAVISAALKPAAERVRGSWKLGSNWTLGYVVVSVLAYCLCAVVPNWVGLITYPDQWASFAGTWAGFFIWPALFLPFAVISLYYPITALIEAVVNARRLTNAITYAVPLIFGLGPVDEVDSYGV